MKLVESKQDKELVFPYYPHVFTVELHTSKSQAHTRGRVLEKAGLAQGRQLLRAVAK